MEQALRRTEWKIKCERCGFYCDAPYVQALSDVPTLFEYLQRHQLIFDGPYDAF